MTFNQLLKIPTYEDEVRLITWNPMHISVLLVRLLKQARKKKN